ncbi:HutD/Ves family protein [Luteimonas sp. e5]
MHIPRIIRLADAARQRWRNGGGWTREIVVGGAGVDWDWRLSRAEIEADGPFSTFPGIQREIVLLSGAGMALCFDDGDCVELCAQMPSLRFDGGRALHARLLDGPAEAFNLMWKPARVDARLERRQVRGNARWSAGSGEVAVLHLAGGRMQLPGTGIELQGGDTLLQPAAGEAMTRPLLGDGFALFVNLSPRRGRPTVRTATAMA